MRRVVIVGPPGGGKSTLAHRLGARHGLPVFHLDHTYRRLGWLPASPGAFRADVERIADLPARAMGGTVGDTVAPRPAKADTIVSMGRDCPER